MDSGTWQKDGAMDDSFDLSAPEARITPRLVDALYTEAMLLADEARAYFDLQSRELRDQMSPLQRVSFSCESLKVTTRLMHVIAWLLSQRAQLENRTSTFNGSTAPLGTAAVTDAAVADRLPDDARSVIIASVALYERVWRIAAPAQHRALKTGSARTLQSQLRRAF